MNFPAPDDVVEFVLAHFFGPTSVVVFCWVLITAAMAWLTLIFQSVRIGGLARRFFSWSRFDFDLGGTAITVGILAGAWVVFYGVASLVTQIWAGGPFSPGQGGGLGELLAWSGLYGLITVVGSVILLPSGRDEVDELLVFIPLIGGAVGYVIGLVYALFAFQMKGGPEPGDWWVAPAASCCLALVAASYFRLALRLRSEKK